MCQLKKSVTTHQLLMQLYLPTMPLRQRQLRLLRL